MFSEVNTRLIEIKGDLRKKQKYEAQIEDFQKELEVVEERIVQLETQYRSEEKDVIQLEKMTLNNLFALLSGTKDEKLSKEKQEFIAAKHRLEEANKTKSEIENSIYELKNKLYMIDDVESRYNQVLFEKEKMIKSSHSRYSDKMYELSEQEGILKAYIQELEEAITAGKNVKHDLLDAQNSLKKARDWGAFDMFGGGTISSFVKHQHLDEAEDCIHKAQTSMRYFQKELLDIHEEAHLEVDISGMLKFADFFFDGFFVDMMVQDKINDSLDQTKSQHSKVNGIVLNLTDQLDEKKKEIESIQKEKQELIESL
ncbi:hypothetical protein [Metabacillus schmidteae]|uniref:hypothetical protein n=1 Tax=Metabacillus schmidteae TaxID=2730405 RepID=UPI00158C6764|nr:hypothetical protein [Metabacillus schmidteae]